MAAKWGWAIGCKRARVAEVAAVNPMYRFRLSKNVEATGAVDAICVPPATGVLPAPAAQNWHLGGRGQPETQKLRALGPAAAVAGWNTGCTTN
jgi:hypothetical protein